MVILLQKNKYTNSMINYNWIDGLLEGLSLLVGRASIATPVEARYMSLSSFVEKENVNFSSTGADTVDIVWKDVWFLGDAAEPAAENTEFSLLVFLSSLTFIGVTAIDFRLLNIDAALNKYCHQNVNHGYFLATIKSIVNTNKWRVCEGKWNNLKKKQKKMYRGKKKGTRRKN